MRRKSKSYIFVSIYTAAALEKRLRNGKMAGRGLRGIRSKQEKEREAVDDSSLGVPNVKSFLLSLPRDGEASGDGERLRSHSAMRFEAVRVSFEGAACVSAGQGMPSATLGSGISWRQSPKLVLVRGLLV
jgi:hypothetical protein